MRTAALAIAGMVVLSAATVTVSACDRHSQAAEHMRLARAEAAAAANQLGKSVDESTSDVVAVGRDLKAGAAKAGQDFKQASQNVRQDLNNKDAD